MYLTLAMHRPWYTLLQETHTPCSLEVRNAIVHLFLNMQKVFLHSIFVSMPSHPWPDFSKAVLEWDESSQYLKLRRGIVSVEGVMPVLVTCLHAQREISQASAQFSTSYTLEGMHTHIQIHTNVHSYSHACKINVSYIIYHKIYSTFHIS